MAITTDSYIDVRDTQSALQDKIGLSETLDNYTLDEITSYCYCGADNNLIRYPLIKTDTPAYASDVDIPCHTESDATNRIVFTAGDASVYSGVSSIYGRVVWLCDTVNSGANVITSSNAVNFKLVTEMKASHYCYEWNAPHTVNVGSTPYGTTTWSGSDMTAHKIWAASGGYLSYYKDFSGGEIIDLSAHHIHPYFIAEINSKLYCIAVSLDINHYKSNYNFYPADPDYPPEAGLSYSSWDESESFDTCYAALQSWDATFANTGWNFPYVYTRTGPGVYGWATIFQGYDTDNVTGLGVVGGTSYGLDCGWEFNYYFKEREDVYKLLSGCGLYFKTDQIYKPIIDNGYVIGYSDDLTSRSDIDTWEGSTNHNIPPSPPPPTPPNPDEDNDDPISTTDAPFGAGIAHYYVTTAGSVILDHISEALGTWDIDSSKKDLYRNLISCKLIKPPAPIPTTGSENFTIYGEQPQYQGSPVLLPVVSGNPSATFGPYSIGRKFNDFRDFAPYSKAEIFLPYCGWTALPSHVIGRSVSVKYFTDIIAATCKAIVFCGNNVVAEAAGVIGLDIPFASENVGAKMEAANMGLLASTLGAVQTAVGVGTMVSTRSGSGLKNVTSGLSQVISGCTQISMAGNENWTEINGKAGDGCSLSGVDTIIIKITRPKYGSNGTAPYVPSGYAHNIGFVSMKETKPGSVTGLLVCDNVDTSGISGATQRERELIKAYLESGIIVNAAPSP